MKNVDLWKKLERRNFCPRPSATQDPESVLSALISEPLVSEMQPCLKCHAEYSFSEHHYSSWSTFLFLHENWASPKMMAWFKLSGEWLTKLMPNFNPTLLITGKCLIWTGCCVRGRRWWERDSSTNNRSTPSDFFSRLWFESITMFNLQEKQDAWLANHWFPKCNHVRNDRRMFFQRTPSDLFIIVDVSISTWERSTVKGRVQTMAFMMVTVDKTTPK